MFPLCVMDLTRMHESNPTKDKDLVLYKSITMIILYQSHYLD